MALKRLVKITGVNADTKYCGFLTTTMVLIQSVGSFTFATIFFTVNSSIFFIISSFIATGIFRDMCYTSHMHLFFPRYSYSGRQISVSKTSPYSFNIFFSERRFVIFAICRSFWYLYFMYHLLVHCLHLGWLNLFYLVFVIFIAFFCICHLKLYHH